MDKKAAFQPHLVLASQSKARQMMLKQAGVEFSVHPSAINEAGILSALEEAEVEAGDIAIELAKEKALEVSSIYPDALVIGADQVLEHQGRLLQKASDLEAAKKKLQRLQGGVHHLYSGVAVVRAGEVLWSHADRAALAMRDLTEEEIDHYCARAGQGLTRSVGAYELEGLGAWLFSEIRGDFFTILGLPLLPLLNYLRKEHEVSL